jgi:hypothetical protein
LKQVVDTPITLTLGTNFERGSTDLSGEFDFGKVIGGEYVLSVTPARGSDLQDVWSWRFVLPVDAVVQLYASVWPQNLDTTTIDTVTLAPPVISLRKGETIRFVAAAKDKDGVALPYAPSLLLVGEVGRLLPEGTFTAEHAGTATLTAWMAGKQTTATIEVFDSKAPATAK